MNNNYNQNTPNNQNINQIIEPPQNQRFTNNQLTQSNHRKRNIVITIAGFLLTIFITATITTLIVNNIDDSETDTEYEETTIIRKNTPLLELYASLNEEMTIDELKAILQKDYSNAKLTIYDDNTGNVSMNDNNNDFVSFYYDTMSTDEEESDEESDEENTTSTPTNYEVSEITDYDPSTLIRDIEYIYQPDELEDSPLSIGYSEDDETYYVNVFYDVFDFATKEQAINAYLSTD